MATRRRLFIGVILLAQFFSGAPAPSVATQYGALPTSPYTPHLVQHGAALGALSPHDRFCKTATSLGSLMVTTFEKDRWDGGATWEVTLTNTQGHEVIDDIRIQFILPGTDRVETWGAAFEVDLPRVAATLPEWNHRLEPQESHTLGLNVFPGSDICGLRIVSAQFTPLGDENSTGEDGNSGSNNPSPTPTAFDPGQGDEIDGGDSGDDIYMPTPTPPPHPGGSGGFSEEPANPTPIFIGDGYQSAAFAPPLHTQGRDIVNQDGDRVLLRGANWFGFETSTFVVHGLWTRNWKDMLHQMADEGFNVIRLPFSQEVVNTNPYPNGIDFYLNPDLQGLRALEILDKVIAEAQKLELYVFLDRHALRADERTSLWYTGSRTAPASQNPYGESAWMEGLEELAHRYKNTPAVIGFDLHNEPHGSASWGSDHLDTDWRLAAERAGNRLLAVNPNLLILVEGVEGNVAGDYSQTYWWGGNLKGVHDHPVRLQKANRLVYSPHVYGAGVYPQDWFYTANYPDNLHDIWYDYWGYIADENIAPILIGEFGGYHANSEYLSYGSDAWREAIAQEMLVDYQLDHKLSGTYWSLNPNSGDTGGYLQDDWVSIVDDKANLLAPWMTP